MEDPGPKRRLSALPVAAGIVIALLGAWAVLAVAWPRLSLGDPLTRQVAMADLPLEQDGPTRCRTALVASWHADVVNYYASTACSGGLRPTAVSVEVAGSDAEPERRTCRGDRWMVLRCTSKEIEGSIDCPAGCAQTELTITHQVRLPEPVGVPGTDHGSCTVEGRELSCSYAVSQDTVSIESVWRHDGNVFLCVTQPTGERRTRLEDFAAPASPDVLAVTPAGPVVTAAALEEALAAPPGLPSLDSDQHASQCG